MATRGRKAGFLDGARVYLSGPMDFVADREAEAKHGWRSRVGQVLRDLGVVVFDPWNKPEVRGLHGFGREDKSSTDARERWTFEDSPEGARQRAGITGKYWETLHIDLRMVDTCDFVVAYCPTNVYSVGTPHEIALCRQQRKPVLLVSPPIEFPAVAALRAHLADRGDARGTRLLEDVVGQVPIKPNERGIPSLWYMPLVGGQGFFDGFGFDLPGFRDRYGWPVMAIDGRERAHPPRRPLLPFLAAIDRKIPQKWDNHDHHYVRNDDWLLWDLREAGARPVQDPHDRKGGANG